MAKLNFRPTRGATLSAEEKSMPRGVEAGVKAWQGGSRLTLIKPAPGTPRPVVQPKWARKYVEA